ncbi:hypothetical protein [Silvibacterium dinghuense]|uniref:Uncharacterized protein n=1 Tax=Silvibacterium dinghuense TaxID=1560006 RepID=A0A4Q1SJF7_9BACT|nr:hypothetical protein [Silvibacterium dinghuense]RXS97567.1 hypothetical protein ESZ00_06680 [Silvibacterium dinghuense]GGH00094.1 hypothetical protein GCM10011586_14600 [Silvibacterium dinghuense]
MKISHESLVHRYLQAVGFWLPRSEKDDILAELRADLEAQIEDRESELRRPLDDAEMAALLKQRGRPVFVAGGFGPQQSLIGPLLYPIYRFVLRIVAIFYLLPWALIAIGIFVYERMHGGTPIASHAWSAMGSLWTIALTQFAVITLVFALVDRYAMTAVMQRDWEPRRLPAVRQPSVGKRRRQAVAGFIFGILGLFWLLALPGYPFLLIGPAAAVLHAAPIWAEVYPLLLVSVGLGIAENALTLAWPQIAWLRPTAGVVTSAFGLWIITRLLHAPVYLLAGDPHAADYAALGNMVAHLAVVFTGIGLLISLLAYAWQAVRALAGESRHPGSPAPLPARRI